MWVILELQPLKTLIFFDRKDIFFSSTPKLLKLCSLDQVFHKTEKSTCLDEFGKCCILFSLQDRGWHLQCHYLRSLAIRKPLDFVQPGIIPGLRDRRIFLLMALA